MAAAAGNSGGEQWERGAHVRFAAHRIARDAELLEMARRAVDRVSREGELKELWEEAAEEDCEAWKKAVEDLRSRLS